MTKSCLLIFKINNKKRVDENMSLSNTVSDPNTFIAFMYYGCQKTFFGCICMMISNVSGYSFYQMIYEKRIVIQTRRNMKFINCNVEYIENVGIWNHFFIYGRILYDEIIVLINFVFLFYKQKKHVDKIFFSINFIVIPS